MSRAKKGFIIAGIILAVIITGFVILFISLDRKAAAFKHDTSGFDLSEVLDGTYTGSADAGIVKATVEVSIKDHSITDIKILSHENGLGKPAEAIVDDIVAENSLEVDVVSGATLSSNVIRMAVYNALIQE